MTSAVSSVTSEASSVSSGVPQSEGSGERGFSAKVSVGFDGFFGFRGFGNVRVGHGERPGFFVLIHEWFLRIVFNFSLVASGARRGRSEEQLQRREIEEGVFFKEIVKNGRNFFCAAFRVAFKVDGENGLVQAHADEYPAVAVRFVKIQPDSLVVFRGRRNEGQGPGIVGQFFDDPVAQGFEIAAFFKVQARFFRFRRLGQVPDEIGEFSPVFALFGQRD